MNVLLIRPAPAQETIGLQHVMICEPLELEYLSSAVKGSDVRTFIVDMILDRRSIEEIVRTYQPDLVGITGYITHVGIIKEMAASIKRIHACTIAVGGVHAEVVPRDFLCDDIDFIVHANGITTFRSLVDRLKSGRDPSAIEGIWHENAGAVAARLQNDTLFPDRDAVRIYRRKYYYMFHTPCALVKTSMGCSYRCRFCFCHKVTGGAYGRRDPEHVAAELETLSEQEIYMVDDNFLHDAAWLRRFIRLLRERNIQKRYLVYGRADFITGHPDLIFELQKVGLRAVIVGLESFSTEELTAYHKKSSREVNEAAVRILRENRIECYGTFITGIDWQVRDFFKLLWWIFRQRLIFINLQPFTPYPGTDIHGQYRTRLRIRQDDYTRWDLAHLVLSPGYLPPRLYYGLTLLLYYVITLNPVSIAAMVRRYGFRQVLKLSMGSSRITGQYLKKVFRGDRV